MAPSLPRAQAPAAGTVRYAAWPHAAYPHRMRVGLTILPEHRWSDAAPMWRAAEEMGFDHAWTYDHLVWAGLPDAPWYGTTPTLTATRTATDIGTARKSLEGPIRSA